jgi:hypothetical protein
MALVRHHPDSARSNYEAGVALATPALEDPGLALAYHDQIKTYFERSVSLDTTAVNGLFSLILFDASNGRPVDEAVVDRVSDRLSRIPLNYTVVDPFRSVVDWMTKETVVLPRDTVLRLFEAALGNRTATQRTRGSLLSLLSSYHHNVEADLQEAVSLAIAAVEEDPSEPVHHLSLATLAINLRNFDLAAHELDAVRRNDVLARFTVQTRELAQALQRAQTESDQVQLDEAISSAL